MKKSMIMVVALLLVFCLVLSGCGKTPEGEDSAKAPDAGGEKSEDSNQASDDNATQGSDQAAEASYTIRLGHSNPDVEGNIVQYASEVFAEKVAEYSNGAINVEIYPSNQLGDERDQMRALQNGSQEMVYGSVQNFATFAPPFYYLSLPYIFTSGEMAEKAVFELWDQHTEWMVEKGGMRPVGWAVAGFRNLTTSADRPVTTLDDAKGVKVRIPPNAVSEAAFKAFGFEPVSLPFSEAFTALQQGVVEGQENCYTTVRAEHYDEVQKYVTDIQWQYTIGIFGMSEIFFDSLPADLQDAVIKAGKDATAAEMEMAKELDAGDIAYLEEKGMEFLGVPTDYEAWVEKGRSIWEDQYELIGEGDAAAGKAIVDAVLEVLEG